VALQDDRLQAVAVVEVHVGAAEHVHVLIMLDVDEFLCQLALVMVEGDDQDPGDLIPCLPRVLHQPLANHVAHQLRTRGVASARDPAVELIQ
jgi:hypothetical protein